MVSYISVSIKFLKLLERVNTYLVDLREQEERQESTENAQRAGNEEWVLASANRVGSTLLKNGQNVGAHESTNLTNGGSIRIVLTTNGSGTALGRTQTKVIPRAKLTKCEEDAIDSQEQHNTIGRSVW